MKRILGKHKLKWVVYFLVYSAQQMQQLGHWKRQRGLANSKNVEQLFLVYKEKQPNNMPKTRMYVDPSSALFMQTIKNVPVLPPKLHALVSKEMRETSLLNMMGQPHEEEASAQPDRPDEEEGAGLHQPDPAKALVAAHVKKRKLYRRMTGEEVPWFPHDNDPELLKEFCWEAGKPPWALYGTPAGGAGLQGCLEMGCSVVALCYDERHRKHWCGTHGGSNSWAFQGCFLDVYTIQISI